MDRVAQRQAERRRARWRQHRWLHDHSPRPGARQCFRPIDMDGTGVTVGVTAEGVVHVKGVKRCGSVHACPKCAPTIREQRAAQVDALLGRALAAGCIVYFVTATVQHHHGQSLSYLWQRLQGSWSAAWSGRDVAWDNGDGYVGQIRAFDLTHGQAGWHPHLHVAVVFEPGSSLSDHRRFLVERRRLYRRALQSVGLYSSATQVGWDVRPVARRDSSGAIARYVAKIDGGWGVGLEMTSNEL